MGQPFPPAGEQKSYTERPLKVYGEQYHAADPLPVGATADVFLPMYPNGDPRVYATTGTYLLHEGDWVVTNRYTGQPTEVLSDEEFSERFGGGGGPPLSEGTG